MLALVVFCSEHVASKHMLHSHVATSPATGQQVSCLSVQIGIATASQLIIGALVCVCVGVCWQEVTTYPHHDSNDNWEVVVSEPLWQAGAQLRLMHDETQHRLHRSVAPLARSVGCRSVGWMVALPVRRVGSAVRRPCAVSAGWRLSPAFIFR